MLLYGVLLILLSVLLLYLEIFIPSGGLLGMAAALSLIGGLVCMFWVSTTAGLTATVVVCIAAPFAVAGALKMFPRTPIGRRMTLGDSQRAGAIRYERNLPEREEELIGATGVAATWLRPVGTCTIDGRRIECLAETGTVEPGVRVRVVSVQGTQVKVRAV